MRYLIKFSKESDIKFISHLDLMRTIQKIVRRTELPVEYSKGFNPHMTLSLAQPLSVGMYSNGEYMDIVLTEQVSEKKVLEQLNNSSPLSIRFLEARKVIDRENEKKIPQSMALIEAAKYKINIKYNSTESLQEDLKQMAALKSWDIIKKSKSGEKEVDIKPMVKELKFKIEEDRLLMSVIVSCGSRENLSADLLSKYVVSHTKNVKKDAFVDIKREEMYAFRNKALVPLYKYVSL